MMFRERDINVFAGPGRHVFELYLSTHSPLTEEGGIKRLCKRLTPESDPGEAALFAFTEDLFIQNKVLIFPDFDDLHKDLMEVAAELIGKREDVKATVILPARNSAKMQKMAGKRIDIVEISEASALKVAVGYVKRLFERQGITAPGELIEFIVLPWIDNPHGLISEAEKLTLAFSKNKVVTVEDLKSFSDAMPELEIFQILREIMRGRSSKGIGDLSRYLKTVDDSELLRVLGALQWALKKEYGRAKKLKAKEKLRRLLFLAGETDLKIKGDSRLPAREVLMNSLVHMAEIVGG
jgi:DNA polymerase III delta subunit